MLQFLFEFMSILGLLFANESYCQFIVSLHVFSNSVLLNICTSWWFLNSVEYLHFNWWFLNFFVCDGARLLWIFTSFVISQGSNFFSTISPIGFISFISDSWIIIQLSSKYSIKISIIEKIRVVAITCYWLIFYLFMRYLIFNFSFSFLINL